MDMFINEDHFESITRFKKDELRNLIENQLVLDEEIFVHIQGYHFFVISIARNYSHAS